ncbi:MAG: aldo/keto reductase, partial [Bacteroidia bacterium]|nr:aldo/keto reductase [Bacteroidia bacterium]
YFFVHETHQSILAIDEVFEAAYQMKKLGKIKAFGVAFMRNQFDLHKNYIQQFDLWQFDCSPGAYNYNHWKDLRGNQSNALFSPLSGGDALLSANDKLIQLQADFPKSVIISSMFNPKHIQENSKLFN